MSTNVRVYRLILMLGLIGFVIYPCFRGGAVLIEQSNGGGWKMYGFCLHSEMVLQLYES
jgi:hypothetical protein